MFVRATQGIATSIPVGKDTAFVQHIDGALAAGLDVGVYHAFIASVDGAAQARFFYDTIAPYLDRLAFPPAIDVELDNGQTPTMITSRLFNMAVALENLGTAKPMIYTSPGFWNAHTVATSDGYFSKCPLWIAHWTTAAKPILPRSWANGTWTIWQHGKADVAGAVGKVDANRRQVAAEKNFTLFKPFEDYVVTSEFNDPRNYSFAPNRKQLHEGEDSVDGDGGRLVYCGRSGTVSKVGFDARGYGNYCIVDFGDGWTCWYAHFARIDVVEGQQVQPKQALGVAGSTGASTGVHCHITLCNPELGLDNYVVPDVVDPAPYLVNW